MNLLALIASWNRRAFQGLQLYVIDAVAVTSTNRILSIEWEQDIVGSARSELLESKAMVMEASIAQKATGKADIICVDGSLVSRLTKSRPEAAALEMVKKCSKCIFISKTSESRLNSARWGQRPATFTTMDTPARRLDLVFLLKHGSAMHHCLKSMQGSRPYSCYQA